MVTILPFAPAHTAGIRDLIVPIQRDEFGIAISYDDQPDLQDIPGVYLRGAGGFWVAVAETAVVGSIALQDLGAGDGALRKMFVHAAFRGREHGVGQALLDRLIAAARAGGLKRLWLGTTPAFKAAHRFYEKNGFIRVDPAALPARFTRVPVDDRFYCLSLT
jgi:GNAT superfamily N-acetyltransferase